MSLARLTRPVCAAAVAIGCVAGTLAVTDSPASAAPVEGTPYTFGGNFFGQLGDDSNVAVSRATPGPVSLLDDAIDIAGGREHVVALRPDGTVWTWGSDEYNQQGNGPGRVDNYSPAKVSGLSGVVDIDDGHRQSFALKSDGTVWGWGFGSLGQLGNGAGSSATPVQFGDINDAVAVTGGNEVTYVLRSDGTVWCSGTNLNGECGYDSAVDPEFHDPVEVPGLDGVVQIAAGRNTGLAIRTDGTVWAWGNNDFGELGDGTTSDRAEPQQVAGISNAVDIAGGAEFSMALTADGSLYSWGQNKHGELGLGDTTDRYGVQQVPGISDGADIDAGREHSLLITDSGTLMAWGWNDSKQSGVDQSSDVLSPTLVPGTHDVLQAGGGQSYSVILVENGTQPPPDEPVFTDGFENGLSGWNGGAGITFDNTRAPVGGSVPSLRVVLAKSTANAWHGLPSSLSHFCTSVDVRLQKKTNFAILRMRQANGSGLLTVQVLHNRRLRIVNELDNSHATSSTRLEPHVWHQVGVCWDSNPGTLGRFSITYDGVIVSSWTEDAAGSAGQVEIGSSRKAQATYNLDNLKVYDTSS